MANEGEPAPNTPFRFNLIGRFAVQERGQQLSDAAIGSRKGRTLLKLLLVNRGHVVPADLIAEVLWGDRPPPKAEENLASLVSRLRGRFGPRIIQGGRRGYAFAVGPWAQTDLDEAERLAAEAEARLSAGEPSLGTIAAERAIALLGAGRLLEEEADPSWAEGSQAHLDRLAGRARRSAWMAALLLSDPHRAIRAAQAAIDASPLDEEPYRALMHAYVQAGEQGAALDVFERLRIVLAEELGVDPSPETQALHLAIVREQPLPEATVLAPPVEASTRDPGFVGRERELATISRRWAAAAAGRPSLIILSGEAGIGKTRLAREAVHVAIKTGGQALEARCYEQERSLFLQPILEALRSALVTMPPEVVYEVVGDQAGTLAELIPEVRRILRPIGYRPAPPEVERRRSFEAVTGTIQRLARRNPVLVVLDDLQEAGASSLELLHFLIRRLSGDRLLVLATLRIEEGEEALSQLEDVAERMDLGPLPDHAVASLAQLMGAAHLSDRILKLSRGHPLFVVEALRAMVESAEGPGAAPLPESLRAAVLSRVQRTGPAVEELLRAAATLGPAFDLPTAAGLLDVTTGEAARRAEHALKARLIVEAGSAYEFANDLIQEVLYQTTPVPTRVLRHRRAAAMLEDNPEAVGAHATAAEDWPLAVEAWLKAGERASARFSNRDAERMLDRALQAAFRAGDRAAEARARLARGRAREDSADFAGAYEDHIAALELARKTGQRDVEMRTLRELGGDVVVGAARPARDGIPFLQSGLAIAEELGDGPAQVDFLSRLAVIWVNLLRFDLAYEHVGRALELARTLGDGGALAAALDGLKTATAYSGDLSALDRVVPELEGVLRSRGDLRYLQWTVFESSFSPMARGQWDLAVERIEEALALNERTGHRSWRPLFLAQLGWIERARGEYGQALRFGREAMDLAEEVGHPWWIAFAGAMLGWTLTDLYAYGAAVEQLERALAAAEVEGSESYLVICLAHLALAMWLDHRKDPAIEMLERAEAILDQVKAPSGSAFLHGGHAYLAAARVRSGLGDHERGQQLAETVLQPAEVAGWHEVAAQASLVTGVCREGLGDAAGAVRRFARALDVSERNGLPRIAWEAHAALARMDKAADRKEKVHASAARSIARRLAASIEDEELRAGFVQGATARAGRR